jgi:hypothetical protein
MYYGPGNFIMDCALIFFTGGLWLIWMIFREMRKRNSVR